MTIKDPSGSQAPLCIRAEENHEIILTNSFSVKFELNLRIKLDRKYCLNP